MSVNVARRGGETRVNTSIDGNQTNVFYTILTDGRIVANWFGKGTQSGQQDDDGMFQQIFDANWNRIGGEVRVNGTTTGIVTDSGYDLPLSNGRYMAFWSVDSSGTDAAYDTYFRVFQANGQAGSEIRISSTPGQGESYPDVYKLANGNSLITWDGSGTQPGQEDDAGIFFRLIGADGTIGSETRMNSFVRERNEDLLLLTPLSDGGWVAVYRSQIDQTNNVYDFWQQAFNADGTKRGGEIKLTSEGGTTSFRPGVKELANGKWMTFWEEGNSATPYDLYSQVFNADGSVSGDKFLATESTEGNQTRSAYSVSLPNGHFLFLWRGKGTQPGQEDDSGYFYQRFDANGAKVGSETRLCATNTGSQTVTKVSDTYLTLQDGQRVKDKTVFLWYGNGTQPGQEDSDGIFIQMLDASGAKIGSEVRVNTTTEGSLATTFIKSTSLTMNGRFVVTWQGKGTQPGQEDDVGFFMQLFDGNGVKIGSEIRVNTTTAGTQTPMYNEALPNGGWVSVWNSQNADGTFDVYQQVFDNNGNRIGSEILVNTTTAGSQVAMEFKVLPDGSWIIGWEGNGTQPGQEDSAGIFFQRFSLSTAPTSLSLSGTIKENAAAGLVAGSLSATAADPTEAGIFTYTLVDAAGAATAHPLFEIVGNTVRVKAGGALDFETATAHTLRVKVADAFGGSYIQDVTVTVTNVLETTPFRKTGTPGNDSLRGELGNDTLTGLAGDDILGGDLGKDRILTGTGKDIVVFDTKPGKTNRDTITDFDPKKDSIHLDNAIFTKLGKKGSVSAPAKLSKGFFALGAAHDKNDYVVYDKKTGVLSYDKDGSGAAKAVEIAVFSNKPALTAADFFVI
ncbi:hypothetical protein [Microvirga calopogonii]|uniref:hypothetical protein n=1 Tax=Microvirga calopogonii TaxID=2078013 RepID=UPI000E0D728E|nr:hypothetical protein [Microvirga calopogonii]